MIQLKGFSDLYLRDWHAQDEKAGRMGVGDRWLSYECKMLGQKNKFWRIHLFHRLHKQPFTLFNHFLILFEDNVSIDLNTKVEAHLQD